MPFLYKFDFFFLSKSSILPIPFVNFYFLCSQILTAKSGEEDYLDTSYLLRQASPYMQIK